MTRVVLVTVVCCLLATGISGRVQDSKATSPASGVDVRRIALIEPLIAQDVKDKKLPGAVVLVGRGDRTVYQKAFGNRALVPAVEPMTTDTIFDLASLTKVVATTTS